MWEFPFVLLWLALALYFIGGRRRRWRRLDR
jgi:hypothetical protein